MGAMESRSFSNELHSIATHRCIADRRVSIGANLSARNPSLNTRFARNPPSTTCKGTMCAQSEISCV
jgi:hypothetical protein